MCSSRFLDIKIADHFLLLAEIYIMQIVFLLWLRSKPSSRVGAIFERMFSNLILI